MTGFDGEGKGGKEKEEDGSQAAHDDAGRWQKRGSLAFVRVKVNMRAVF